MIGGLTSEGITRVRLEGGEVVAQDHIPLARRVREVEEGPEGDIYVLTDHADGSLWKLSPQEASN